MSARQGFSYVNVDPSKICGDGRVVRDRALVAMRTAIRGDMRCVHDVRLGRHSLTGCDSYD